jgi:hypothetical protein
VAGHEGLPGLANHLDVAGAAVVRYEHLDANRKGSML